MRVPTRRGEKERKRKIDYHVTAKKLARMKVELEDIVKRRHPEAAAEVQRTGAFGDFSENGEYQHAKSVMRRLLARIDWLKHRIAHAVVIAEASGNVVALGTSVTVQGEKGEKTYHLVGASEVKPSAGYISHNSPFGKALLGHIVGDAVTIETPAGTKKYRIVRIEAQ